MGPLCTFGLSQEDERTEVAALGLPGGRVLSVAGAGDMPLSLLALGADRVDAVDFSLAQIRLAELKLAAVVELEPGEAARFLGLLPAARAARSAWLRRVAGALSAPARGFWWAREKTVRRGAVWAGRFERYAGWIRRATGPVLRSGFERLFAAASLEEQREVFRRRLDTPLLRAAFRVAFEPRRYARRGIDPRALRHVAAGQPLGARWFGLFRDMCTATPARENYFLQLLTLGSLVDAAAAPSYLQPAGAAIVRQRRRSLTLECRPIAAWLEESEPRRYDRFHLSNLCDWMAPAEHDRLLELVAARAAGGARLVWRYLHRAGGVPASLAGRIVTDEAAGADLRRRDRFPLYGIVPARIA
jgi:S-adenosylmethionine-diacylglycerol 3-amino-3-carboxypropyl transferase